MVTDMTDNKTKKAYALSRNVYDDTLTQTKWWSKLYIRCFWGGVDDVAIANHVLDMIPDDFAGKLLDVPVGTGVFTAGRYQSWPKAQIVGLDYSRDMLDQAKKRFSFHQLENTICIQGDVGNLVFDDEEFDVVLSMNGFHAFPDKERAFSETARVLKKGGIFCGCSYIKGQNRRTDLLVNAVLAPKGWFAPPFQSLDELRTKLAARYAKVEIQNQQSMACYRCVK